MMKEAIFTEFLGQLHFSLRNSLDLGTVRKNSKGKEIITASVD